LNQYETVIIIDPNAEAENVERIVNDVQAIITNGGGTISKVDNWGKKRLAYEVQGHKDGTYILINFESEPDLIQSLARSYGLTEQIIKYMTVRAEDLAEIAADVRARSDDGDDEEDRGRRPSYRRSDSDDDDNDGDNDDDNDED
jgi:small subunit ribosomal protein S6